MSTEKGAHASAPECGEKRLKRPPRLVKNRNVARVRLNGRDFYCGAWGSKEARKRYRDLIAEWNEHDCKLPAVLDDAEPAGATVDEIIALYDAHELPTRPASMQKRIKLALDPLHDRYGTKLASEFTALDLSALRAGMVAGGKLTRGMVNQRVSFIRGMFTWAAAMGRTDERVAFRLSTVKSLRRGLAMREGRNVQPIDWPTVEATLRHVTEPVRGLILFQWHTGARPGEACALTANQLDRTGKVWIYALAHHKTEHHGKSRRIFVGAEAQALLRPFLVRRPADKPLFSPLEAIAEQKVERAGKRRNPRQPSQVARARRRAAHPKLEVADGYDVHTYRRAIARAVNAANAVVRREALRVRLVAMAADDARRAAIEDAVGRLPTFVAEPARARLVRRIGDALDADKAAREKLAEVVKAELKAPGRFEQWHPHRLRHAFAQRAERETGDLDAVRASLGHATLTMAARYAHPDDRKARELAERIG